MNKVVSFEKAASIFQSNKTIGIVGVIGWIVPEKMLMALANRFFKENAPTGMTIFNPCAVGDGVQIKGLDHVMHKGMTRRLIAGNLINTPDPATGERPLTMRRILANDVEAYTLHIGIMSHLLREIARKSPGYMTDVGLGTFVDPDLGGGKVTACCSEDLVEKIKFRGKEYLFVPTFDMDYAIIRATASDEHGNLSYEEDPLMGSSLSMAMATKASGGKVIAQVKRIVKPGERNAQVVKIPSNLVDYVVVDPDQQMVTGRNDYQSFMGQKRVVPSTLPKIPHTAERIVADRSCDLIKKHQLTIYGFGASSRIPSLLAERGLLDGDGIYDYPATTEHGHYGGIVTSGWEFSANLNVDAMVDGVTQFDAIHSGICEGCALAFAQFDRHGNVNVSKFGNANPGSGGFIDIVHTAKNVIFNGTFTTAGLKIETGNGTLKILQEGKICKFTKQVEQVTYPLLEGVKRGEKDVHVVTERAVFQLRPDGVYLIEVAPGIDVQTQILDLMEFEPKLLVDDIKDIKRMNADLFTKKG